MTRRHWTFLAAFWLVLFLVFDAVAVPRYGLLAQIARWGAVANTVDLGFIQAPVAAMNAFTEILTIRGTNGSTFTIQGDDADGLVKLRIRNGDTADVSSTKHGFWIESTDEIFLQSITGTFVDVGGFIPPNGTDPTVCVALSEMYLDTDGSTTNANCASATTDPNFCICTAVGTPGTWHPIE